MALTFRIIVTVAVLGLALACTNDTDCTLSGECVDGQCHCRLPWTGDDCGVLKFGPSVEPAAYGYDPNVTSWGGNIIEYNGIYHLYVTQIAHGGLKSWGRSSEVVHATSTSLDKPFVKKDVAVPILAHNPEVVLGRNSTNGTVFVIFHIFPGSKTADTTLNASDNTAHVSYSTEGPWQPFTLNMQCDNPAPMQHPNGTWYVVCNTRNFVLYRADAFSGPYVEVAEFPGRPPLTGVWEDPFLYLDTVGNWHVIAHSWDHTIKTNCNASNVSGHFFSADGMNWESTRTPPYGHEVTFTDGSTKIFSTVERPKMYLNATGFPTHMTFGVDPHAECGQYCSSCKTTEGFDDTYTLLRPLSIDS
eukprot:m.107686 g.107686  ORF g.107686 m.107686 type:complete len:359 (+) comp15317_c0_seq21:140-1216(+)